MYPGDEAAAQKGDAQGCGHELIIAPADGGVGAPFPSPTQAGLGTRFCGYFLVADQLWPFDMPLMVLPDTVPVYF